MNATPRHCQGWGLAGGESKVTYHNKKIPAGGWNRVRKVGAICVLRPLDLGGLGERLFCQTCWSLAVLENARLQHPLLGAKKKKKALPADPRQIRML